MVSQGQSLAVAANSVYSRKTKQETAWLQGPRFSQGNWTSEICFTWSQRDFYCLFFFLSFFLFFFS